MYHCILSETFKVTSWGNQPHPVELVVIIS